MKEVISLQARIDLPLDVIVDAVGPEVSRALIAGYGRRAVKSKPAFAALLTAVDRVVSALNTLERNSQSVGESGAREQLLKAAAELRAVRTKHRNL